MPAYSTQLFVVRWVTIQSAGNIVNLQQSTAMSYPSPLPQLSGALAVALLSKTLNNAGCVAIYTFQLTLAFSLIQGDAFYINFSPAFAPRLHS